MGGADDFPYSAMAQHKPYSAKSARQLLRFSLAANICVEGLRQASLANGKREGKERPALATAVATDQSDLFLTDV